MRKLLLLPLVIGAVFFVGCEKDPGKAFPGTWDVSDGGIIIFTEDGYGYSTGPVNSYLENFCTTKDTNYFVWTATQSGTSKKGTLYLGFIPDDTTSGCSSTLEIPYKIKSNKTIQLGVNAGILDFSFDLNKK